MVPSVGDGRLSLRRCPGRRSPTVRKRKVDLARSSSRALPALAPVTEGSAARDGDETPRSPVLASRSARGIFGARSSSSSLSSMTPSPSSPLRASRSVTTWQDQCRAGRMQAVSIILMAYASPEQKAAAARRFTELNEGSDAVQLAVSSARQKMRVFDTVSQNPDQHETVASALLDKQTEAQQHRQLKGRKRPAVSLADFKHLEKHFRAWHFFVKWSRSDALAIAEKEWRVKRDLEAANRWEQPTYRRAKVLQIAFGAWRSFFCALRRAALRPASFLLLDDDGGGGGGGDDDASLGVYDAMTASTATEATPMDRLAQPRVRDFGAEEVEDRLQAERRRKHEPVWHPVGKSPADFAERRLVVAQQGDDDGASKEARPSDDASLSSSVVTTLGKRLATRKLAKPRMGRRKEQGKTKIAPLLRPLGGAPSTQSWSSAATLKSHQSSTGTAFLSSVPHSTASGYARHAARPKRFVDHQRLLPALGGGGGGGRRQGGLETPAALYRHLMRASPRFEPEPDVESDARAEETPRATHSEGSSSQVPSPVSSVTYDDASMVLLKTYLDSPRSLKYPTTQAAAPRRAGPASPPSSKKLAHPHRKHRQADHLSVVDRYAKLSIAIAAMGDDPGEWVAQWTARAEGRVPEPPLLLAPRITLASPRNTFASTDDSDATSFATSTTNTVATRLDASATSLVLLTSQRLLAPTLSPQRPTKLWTSPTAPPNHPSSSATDSTERRRRGG